MKGRESKPWLSEFCARSAKTKKNTQQNTKRKESERKSPRSREKIHRANKKATNPPLFWSILSYLHLRPQSSWGSARTPSSPLSSSLTVVSMALLQFPSRLYRPTCASWTSRHGMWSPLLLTHFRSNFYFPSHFLVSLSADLLNNYFLRLPRFSAFPLGFSIHCFELFSALGLLAVAKFFSFDREYWFILPIRLMSIPHFEPLFFGFFYLTVRRRRQLHRKWQHWGFHWRCWKVTHFSIPISLCLLSCSNALGFSSNISSIFQVNSSKFVAGNETQYLVFASGYYLLAYIRTQCCVDDGCWREVAAKDRGHGRRR